MLRVTPYRESDAVVALFTREHGRISALARGARASRRRFAGTLGLLVLGRYELHRRPRAELWTLEAADQVREWTRLAADVAALAHASYGIEIVRELAPPEEPEPRLLDLLIELCDALAEVGPSATVLRAFELAVLDALGHAPMLDVCAGCGHADALGDAGMVFDPGRGGAVCAGCAARSRGAGVRPLPAGARDLLLALRDLPRLADAAAPVDVEVDDADRAAARDALVGMIVGLVGRPLRSVEFIAKVSAHRSP